MYARYPDTITCFGWIKHRVTLCRGNVLTELRRLIGIKSFSHSLLEQIQNLSISERILLVEDIWDSIAKENKSFDLTEEQKQELDRRLEFSRNNPNAGRSWDEIKEEFMRSK